VVRRIALDGGATGRAGCEDERERLAQVTVAMAPCFIVAPLANYSGGRLGLVRGRCQGSEA